MIIVGMDYHPSVQQVVFLDMETGETGERRLNHSDGEAERFYRDLQRRQVKVRVGIEASGHARWFERLLAGGAQLTFHYDRKQVILEKTEVAKGLARGVCRRFRFRGQTS
jgi:hypothetical protein